MRLIANALHAIGDVRLAEQDSLLSNDRLVIGSSLALEDLYRSRSGRLQRCFAYNKAGHEDANLVQVSFTRSAEAVGIRRARSKSPKPNLAEWRPACCAIAPGQPSSDRWPSRYKERKQG